MIANHLKLGKEMSFNDYMSICSTGIPVGGDMIFKEQLVLKSGKEIDANKDIIGLSPEGELYEGYDGYMDMGEIFSRQDKLDIADHMIRRWEAYRKGVSHE